MGGEGGLIVARYKAPNANPPIRIIPAPLVPASTTCVATTVVAEGLTHVPDLAFMLYVPAIIGIHITEHVLFVDVVLHVPNTVLVFIFTNSIVNAPATDGVIVAVNVIGLLTKIVDLLAITLLIDKHVAAEGLTITDVAVVLVH